MCSSDLKPPLQIFQELGLVGCFNGDADLSVNYKTKMADYLRAKQEEDRYGIKIIYLKIYFLHNHDFII